MRKLRKSEINRIIKEDASLSNEGLIKKYFDLVYHDVLGSQAEQMEEAGWNESDVKERREYEHYMSYYTDILGDYHNTDGIIYKSFERATDFSEVTNFEVKQYYSNYYPFGVYFYVTLRGNKIETSYNSDGSVREQVEETVEYTFDTTALADSEYQRWSSAAVFRKDYQTYINDILDFSYNAV